MNPGLCLRTDTGPFQVNRREQTAFISIRLD